MAMATIALFNFKGGTAKTTTSVNLAAGFAELGERVLLIDADMQGQVAISLGLKPERTLFDWLTHAATLEEVATDVRPGLDVVVADARLEAFETHATAFDASMFVFEGYDRVIIDCAPGYSAMNLAMLGSVDRIVLPVAADFLSVAGIKRVLQVIDQLQGYGVSAPQISVLPTLYDVRNNICREAVDALMDYFGEQCLEPIRVNTKLKEAPSVKKTIFEYAPFSHGALDYRCLVERLASEDRQHHTLPAQLTQGLAELDDQEGWADVDAQELELIAAEATVDPALTWAS